MLKKPAAAVLSNKLFGAILIGYLALAFGFSVANPIYESTDELHHFRYVRYLQQYGQLPEQRADQPRIQAHHPPLYYLLAALASGWIAPDHDALYEPVHNPYYAFRYWEINNDNKNQYLHGPDENWPYHGVVLMVHVARWVNVILGAIMVWVTYRIGLAVFPKRKPVAAGAAAIVAFNPQFLFMSGAVNNDVIAGLFGSILLLLGIHIVRDGLTTRQAVWFGIAFGLALMAKFSLIFALLLIELALLLTVRSTRDWRGFVKANLIVLVCTVVIAGWWFVRNVQLYGEPTGIQRMNQLWGGRNPADSFWLAVSEIPYAWSSLWGRFGYGQIPLPDGIYTAALIVSLLGLVGLIVAFVRRSFDRMQIKLLALAAFAALLFAGALFGYMLSSTAGPMGRFYFPGLSAFGLLLCLGTTEVLRAATPSRLHVSRFPPYIVSLAAFGFALVAFFGYFLPAYAAPPTLNAAQINSLAHPLNVTFGGKAELLGADLDRDSAQPGDPVRVTLYWRALAPMGQSYVEFVHLIDGDGIVVAQRDTWPGRGMYPTVMWQPGQVFADSLLVYAPDAAYAPDQTTVRVGLYETDSPRLKALDAQGQPIEDDAVPLGPVAITPHPGDYPNPMLVNFGDKVDLVGYQMSPRSIQAGEAVAVTLCWRSRVSFDADYSVFLTALLPDDRKSAEDTSKPIHGPFSTKLWQPGRVITDVRVLAFPPHAKSGQLDVEVGWFLPGSSRLPVLAGDGHTLDSRQLLTPIRIR